MDKLLQIFTTRELATGFWYLVCLVLLLSGKLFRKSLVKISTVLFRRVLIVAMASFTIYIILLIVLLYIVHFWNIGMIKDTLIWFLFSATGIFFNVRKAKDFSFFKAILKESVGIIVIVEFITNLYTFSLITEILLVFLFTFLSLLHILAEHYRKEDVRFSLTASSLNKIMGWLGSILFLYVIVMTVIDYKGWFSVESLKYFLLPIILTVLTLPYFYILALYMEYENLFTVIRHTHRFQEPVIAKNLKRATLLYANFSRYRLRKVWDYHLYFKPEKESAFQYIRKIVRKPKYRIEINAMLPVFNNIGYVLNTLSENGLGKLDEWRTFGDNYFSMSKMLTWDEGSPIMIPNNLQYYLTGGETWIEEINLILDIGRKQNNEQAMAKFADIAVLTFERLQLDCPTEFLLAIKERKECDIECGNHSLKLEHKCFELTENWTLRIISKTIT